MRIAVYSIALNEAHNVERWSLSAQDADMILLADTGSTDDTVRVARATGIEVVQINISPWRFDMARNAALAALPLDIDYCVALDLDEVLVPGWRAAMEAMPPEVTRPYFWYTWNWNPDGSPGVQFWRNLAHARKGYRWQNPVHEELVAYGWPREIAMQVPGFAVQQFHEVKPTRTSYLPLLAMACREDPSNAQMAFWHARESLYAGATGEAAAELRRYLSLPTAVWKPERAAAMRLLAQAEPEARVAWLRAATVEAPTHREALIELAEAHIEAEQWPEAVQAASAALRITERTNDYLVEPWAWSERPATLLSTAQARLAAS